jgi:hypothetical protein
LFYKMLQVASPVPPVLGLPLTVDGLRVRVPILAGIIGTSSTPFLLAVETGQVVLGISVELAAVIFPAALPPAFGSTANKLVRVISGS